MDLDHETLIPLKAAQRYLLFPVTEDTLRRWCNRGAFHRSAKEFITLEHIREGGRILTSIEAISRFREKMSRR